jgi:hypothetical protein
MDTMIKSNRATNRINPNLGLIVIPIDVIKSPTVSIAINIEITPNRADLIISGDVCSLILDKSRPQLIENIVNKMNFTMGGIFLNIASKNIIINVVMISPQKYKLFSNKSGDFTRNAIINVTNNWKMRFPNDFSKKVFFSLRSLKKSTFLFNPPIFRLNKRLYVLELTIFNYSLDFYLFIILINE